MSSVTWSISDPTITAAVLGGLTGGVLATLGTCIIFLLQRKSERIGRTFDVCEKILSDDFSKRRLSCLQYLDTCTATELDKIVNIMDNDTNATRSEILTILNKYDVYLKAADLSILSYKVLDASIGHVMKSDFERTLSFRYKVREYQKNKYPKDKYEGVPHLRKYFYKNYREQ